MAVVKMCKIQLCGLKKQRKQIIEIIQHLGILELTEEPPKADMERMNTESIARQLWEQTRKAEQAIEILQKEVALPALSSEKIQAGKSSAGNPDTGMTKTGKVSAGKITASASENRKHTHPPDWEEISGQMHRILQNREEYKKTQGELVRLEKQEAQLERWETLTCPMGLRETGQTKIWYGIFSGLYTKEMLEEMVQQDADSAIPAQVHIISADKYQTCIGVVCHKSVAKQVYDRLRAHNMTDAPNLTEQIPKDAAASCKEAQRLHRRHLQLLTGELTALGNSIQSLQAYADASRARAVKYDALRELNQSRYCFFLQGYMPEKQSQLLEQALSDYTIQMETIPLSEGEELPVLLRNNTTTEPLEGVVASYGLPTKREFDPTGIMSIFYYVFFGIMLSDAVYGFIISLTCFLWLRRMPDRESAFAKSIRMFFYCGISTLVWGILFGSYFGDLAVLLSERTGYDLTISPLWFAPLDDPMRMLMYSMLFGVIHLFTGLGCSGYLLLKEGRAADFICDVVLWYVLLCGLLLLLLPSSIFTAISGITLVLPSWLVKTGGWMASLGAVGLLLFAGRNASNAGVRLALGGYALYNLTGWLSDVLSYSRLLALGLATGVIASVINTMAGMMGDGLFGTIGFLLIFLIGHTFNIAVNLLGAYVHTNRLQYVEFFGKFYTGGGRAFAPFTEQKQYRR